jgi:hypothetical protein
MSDSREVGANSSLNVSGPLRISFNLTLKNP